MARMHNPPHPGEILQGLYMEPLGLSVTEVAGRLGVDRKTISRIVNGRSPVTVDMALRLGKAFHTTPDLWLNMQQGHDLWHAERRKKHEVAGIKPFPKEVRDSTHSPA